MRITDVPAGDWDERVPFPMLSTGFARACRTLGQRALYATDGVGRALILVRALPGPIVRWWTARAKVYVDAPRAGFVTALVSRLRAEGISYVRLGDAAWGLPATAGSCAGMVRLTTHLVTFDATGSEADALARVSAKSRWRIRRAAREGVVVDEVRDEAGLGAFCALVEETRDRMRARDVAAALPAAFYRAVFREMVPRGDAVLLLARAGDRPLAGSLFFVSSTRMSYYHGASTRDRDLTGLNGPTAMFWRAIQVARARRVPTFDLGAVTPTDDPAHPNYSVYHFKSRFGGEVEPLESAEIQLSPLKCRFQDHVVLPAWKRMYPWYLSLVGRTA